MPRFALALGVAALFCLSTTAHAEMGEGNSGPDVRALQRALNLYGSKLDVEGVFEKKTKRAVRRFQRKHKLQVTGVANRATMGRLLQPLKRGDKGSVVRRLQRLLDAPVTGSFRQSTEDAVKRFQRENDLEPTGEFSPRYLGLLEDDPESVMDEKEEDKNPNAQDGSQNPGITGGGTAGADGSEFEDDEAKDGTTTGKLGGELDDRFSGLENKDGQSSDSSADASQAGGGGGRFANGAGPYAENGSQGGNALGGSVTPEQQDNLAGYRAPETNNPGSTTGGGGSGSQQGGGNGSQQGGGSGSQQGGGGSGSQQGGTSQGGSQQNGSQSKSGQGGRENEEFSSKSLPHKKFKSIGELASALETLKVIDEIQKLLSQGTKEEALVMAMKAMKGRTKGQQAKALIDLAIKVYEIPGPKGKKQYIEPALKAVLKAEAVKIGAVPERPTSPQGVFQAAYDKQVAQRFPGLK